MMNSECKTCGYYGALKTATQCEACAKPAANAPAHEREAYDRYQRVHKRNG